MLKKTLKTPIATLILWWWILNRQAQLKFIQIIIVHFMCISNSHINQSYEICP